MSESTDLRLVGRSADGTELELVDQDGNKFNLRISDSLRSNVNQPRLAAVSDFQEEVSTTVKEVQARLRGGESIDSPARSLACTSFTVVVATSLKSETAASLG